MAAVTRADWIASWGRPRCARTHGPRQHRSQHSGQQHVRDPRKEALAPEHDHDRQDGNTESRQMGLGQGGADYVVDRFVLVGRGLLDDAKKLGKLRGRDDQGSRVGEAVNDGMGQEVDHHPKPQQSEKQLKAADQQREQHRVGHEPFAAGGGQRRERRRGHQRHHRYRSGGELAAGAE